MALSVTRSNGSAAQSGDVEMRDASAAKVVDVAAVLKDGSIMALLQAKKRELAEAEANERSAKKPREEVTLEKMQAAMGNGREWAALALTISKDAYSLAYETLVARVDCEEGDRQHIDAACQHLYHIVVAHGKKFHAENHPDILMIGLSLKLDVAPFWTTLSDEEKKACLLFIYQMDPKVDFNLMMKVFEITPSLALPVCQKMAEHYQKLSSREEKSQFQDVCVPTARALIPLVKRGCTAEEHFALQCTLSDLYILPADLTEAVGETKRGEFLRYLLFDTSYLRWGVLSKRGLRPAEELQLLVTAKERITLTRIYTLAELKARCKTSLSQLHDRLLANLPHWTCAQWMELLTTSQTLELLTPTVLETFAADLKKRNPTLFALHLKTLTTIFAKNPTLLAHLNPTKMQPIIKVE